jgi:hypothetical protein
LGARRPGVGEGDCPRYGVPRIRKEFLEEERQQMGNTWFEQEYLCEFVDNGRNLFRREVVRAALEDRKPLGL